MLVLVCWNVTKNRMSATSNKTSSLFDFFKKYIYTGPVANNLPGADMEMKKNSPNPFDMFDGVLVINLDTDLYKWVNFHNQACVYGFEHKVERVSGVYSSNGAYGCAQSHKKCLDIARSKGWNNVLIFEDDVKFLYDENYTNKVLHKSLTDLTDKSWDLFYLGMSMRGRAYPSNIEVSPGDLLNPDGQWFGRFSYALNKSCFDVFDSLPNEQAFSRDDRGDVKLRSRKDLNKYVVWPALTSVTNTPSKTDMFLTDGGSFVETRYTTFEMIDTEHVMLGDKNVLRCKDAVLKGTNGSISVVMPAYGVADFIEEALDSVYAENPGEILVGIDKCSATLNKLLSIRHKYPTLKIYWSEENKGPFLMRNTMAYNSTLPNIVFFDTDDIMKPGMLTKIREELEDGYDLVRYRLTKFRHGTDPAKGEDVSWYACGSTGMTREAFLKAGGFQNWRCAGDREMINRCAAQGLKEKCLPKALYFYRIHGSNLTTTKDTGMKSALRKKYHDFMKEPVTELFVKPVLAKMYEIKGSYVVSANMGTFMERSTVVKTTVDSVTPYVDLLRIYLNDYATIPEWMVKHPKLHVVMGPDRKSASRFTWAEEKKFEYFFTIDDDIRYTKEYFDKHIAFLRNNVGSVVSIHGHILKEFAESPYAMSSKSVSQVYYKSNTSDLRVDIAGAGVMAFDLSINQFPLSLFPYSDVTDATIGMLCKNKGVPLYVRAHTDGEALALTLPKGCKTLWGQREGPRKIRARAIWSKIINKPDIALVKDLTYSDYLKKGYYTNKGMAELLYNWQYKKLCDKPEKLDLYAFGKRLGLRQAKFIHTGHINDPFPPLPASFCLKPIDGAGARGVFLIHKGTNLRDGKHYSMEDLRQAYLKDSTRYINYSLNYFVEELLLNDNDIPDDVNLFMVEDKVGCILQAKRLGRGKGKVFYDADWNVIGATGIPREKPDTKFMNESVKTAKAIMKELHLPAMRVDFYPVKGKGAYLGELTGVSGVFSPNLTTSFKEVEEGTLLDKYCGWLLSFVDRCDYPDVWPCLRA